MEAPRWGQAFCTRPTSPEVVRKAMSSSPRSLTRRGGPSGAGSSCELTAGIQYWRIRSPMGVPGPTLHISSLSWSLSMSCSFASWFQAVILRRSGFRCVPMSRRVNPPGLNSYGFTVPWVDRIRSRGRFRATSCRLRASFRRRRDRPRRSPRVDRRDRGRRCRLQVARRR